MKKAKDQQAGYVASADFGSAAVCAQCQMFVLPLGHREGDSPVAHEPPNIPHNVMLQVSRGKSSTGPLDSPHVPPRGLVTSFSQLPLF